MNNTNYLYTIVLKTCTCTYNVPFTTSSDSHLLNSILSNLTMSKTRCCASTNHSRDVTLITILTKFEGQVTPLYMYLTYNKFDHRSNNKSTMI